jgi:hypothetical protein
MRPDNQFSVPGRTDPIRLFRYFRSVYRRRRSDVLRRNAAWAEEARTTPTVQSAMDTADREAAAATVPISVTVRTARRLRPAARTRLTG